MRHLFILLAAAGLLCQSVAEAAPQNDDKRTEMTEAIDWFDHLTWPELKGKEYVALTIAEDPPKADADQPPTTRGFLLAEDEKSYTLYSDGTSLAFGFFSNGRWPLFAQTYQKAGDWGIAKYKTVVRKLDLPKSVAELLAERKAMDPDEHRSRFNRSRLNEAAALFAFARCCAHAGYSKEASLLDKAALQEMSPSRRAEQVSVKAYLEQEFSRLAMWKVIEEFGNPSIGRPELLAQMERIVRDFPQSEYRPRAEGYVSLLRKMIAEDKAHAEARPELEKMTEAEQVREWLFRLRDQNGRQFSQPGSCDIFGDWGMGDGDTPAHHLKKLGAAAVPALIEALNDSRPTRSVGFHRNFYFSHFVLSIGDCAEAILSRIAGRSFWVSHTTFGAMEKDGQTKATRTAAEEWWKEYQKKGEKVMLAEGVSAGGPDSYEQASRLAKLDPAACLAAIQEGLSAAQSPWVRGNLTHVVSSIKDEAATAFLRNIMTSDSSLAARVVAATELLRRGEKDPVPVMLAAWRKVEFSERDGLFQSGEGVEALIAFLSACREATAIQNLAERFSRAPIAVRMEIIEVLEKGRASGQEPAKQSGEPLAVTAQKEDLLMMALEDRTVRYGFSGSRSTPAGRYSYQNPRVCEMAAIALAGCFPARYSFQWSGTRLERDRQNTGNAQ